jgi:hypothetical protein
MSDDWMVCVCGSTVEAMTAEPSIERDVDLVYVSEGGNNGQQGIDYNRQQRTDQPPCKYNHQLCVGVHM